MNYFDGFLALSDCKSFKTCKKTYVRWLGISCFQLIQLQHLWISWKHEKWTFSFFSLLKVHTPHFYDAYTPCVDFSNFQFIWNFSQHTFFDCSHTHSPFAMRVSLRCCHSSKVAFLSFLSHISSKFKSQNLFSQLKELLKKPLTLSYGNWIIIYSDNSLAFF